MGFLGALAPKSLFFFSLGFRYFNKLPYLECLQSKHSKQAVFGDSQKAD